MKRNRWLRFIAPVLVVGVVAFRAPVAQAGGFSIFEQGAKATAMGGAAVAGVSDESAMFYNPAAVAQFDHFEGLAGITLIIPKSEMSAGQNPYPGAGYSNDQRTHYFPLPHFMVVAPISKNVNLALGAWAPFGLSTDWKDPDQFAGRFLSQRVDLRQYALGLQVSAKLSDWFYVGGGPEARIGDVKLQRNVPLFNPFTNRVVDAAHVNIASDGFEIKITWAAGILIKATKNFKIGVAHHAHVDVDYSGDAFFYQLGSGNSQLDGVFASRIPVNKPVPVSTSVQFPSVTMFGVSWNCGDRFTISADADYWTWKVFDQTVLKFGTVDGKTPPVSTLTHNWENTWQFRAGANYRVTPKVDVSVGGLYDNTPQPDADFSPLLPDANRTGVSIGAGFNLGKSSRIDIANLFLFFHERTTTTNKDNFNGTYKTFANLFVLNFRTTL